MVPTEPELVLLLESTRVAVTLWRLRAAALDMPWGSVSLELWCCVLGGPPGALPLPAGSACVEG